MTGVRIIAARRSIVAPRGGALSRLALHEMVVPVLSSALGDAGLGAENVDELILANALGAGGNPARIAALAAGLPDRAAGLTLDRQCAGGVDAILLGRALIASGQARVVVAGGVESFSRRPYRAVTDPDGSLRPYEQPPFTPWPDRDPDMTEAAAALAAELGISRAEQDEWAVASHARALAARDRVAPEITPIPGVSETHDTFTRSLTAAAAARARPISGSITAANAAVAADASAILVLASGDVAGGRGVEIVDGLTLGGDPERPGLAPIEAIRTILGRHSLDPQALRTVEIMEAYAVQAIACQRGAGIDPQRVNPGGGALARGHPIGASGAILAVRMFHDLCRDPGIGLAAIAAAGGIGSALLLRS